MPPHRQFAQVRAHPFPPRCVEGQHGRAVPAAGEHALALAGTDRPDILVANYHLHDELGDVGALQALREVCGELVPTALTAADGSLTLKHAARDPGLPALRRSVRLARLRAFLAAQ